MLVVECFYIEVGLNCDTVVYLAETYAKVANDTVMENLCKKKKLYKNLLNRIIDVVQNKSETIYYKDKRNVINID